MTLQECKENIGRKVIYRRDDCKAEHGVIVAVTAMYALIKYENDRMTKSTHPSNLILDLREEIPDEIYIVEIEDEDGFGYECYNGTDEIEAKRIYDEILSIKTLNPIKVVEFYKKTILHKTERK